MPCTQTLSGIARDCTSNIGGIKNAFIANFDDVTAVTETLNKISDITMASSKKFKKYHFRKGTGSVTSTLNVDPTTGVNFVQSDIILQFSKMETTKRIEIAALAQAELAVIIEDMNGLFWYYGRQEGVSASAGTGQTGTARTDGNYYQITLQDNDASFPLEVDSSIITDIVE